MKTERSEMLAHSLPRKQKGRERSCRMSQPVTSPQRRGQPPCTEYVSIRRENKDREAL